MFSRHTNADATNLSALLNALDGRAMRKRPVAAAGGRGGYVVDPDFESEKRRARRNDTKDEE